MCFLRHYRVASVSRRGAALPSAEPAGRPRALRDTHLSYAALADKISTGAPRFFVSPSAAAPLRHASPRRCHVLRCRYKTQRGSGGILLACASAFRLLIVAPAKELCLSHLTKIIGAMISLYFPTMYPLPPLSIMGYRRKHII